MKNTFRTITMLATIGLGLFVSCDSGDDPDPDNNTVVKVEVDNFTLTIAENPEDGLILGTLEASADDATITFNLSDEEPAGAIELNAQTGELRVADASKFDFEVNSEIRATVTAAIENDTASANITITLTDVEELNQGSNGLIAYYSFDNTLVDSLGNLPELEIAGTGDAPMPAQDRNNEVKAYNILAGQYFKIPSQELLVEEDKSFTISFWVYPQGTRQVLQSIVFKDKDLELQVSPGQFVNGTSFRGAIRYGLPSEVADAWGQQLRVGSANSSLGSDPKILRWSHVALTSDGTTAKLFVNGRNVYEFEITETTFAINNSDLIIGAALDGDGNITNNYRGTIDELRFFNQGLTEAQITDLATDNAGL